MIKIQNIKFIVFSIIGVFNTILDIVIYTVLRSNGQSVLVSNIISVSIALIGSYLLNSRITFKAKKWTTLSFLGFLAVTLFGLWVLQTAVIYLIVDHLKLLGTSWLTIFGRKKGLVKIVVPKILATGVTFIWNYIWYSKVIFKNINKSEQLLISIDE